MIRPESRTANYRTDIDGLRAIAVLAVMFFHARIPGFSGGFVGVDVFFVISGYLITRLIVEETEAGKFSLARFYARRIRRIVPALSVVVLTTTAASFLLMTPGELEAYGASVIAVALMVANILFFSQSGYFAGPADQIALLHTWSLSVEEQFYLVWPVFLIGVHRWRGGAHARSVITVTSLVSLLVSAWAAERAPEFGFYVLLPRMWELLLGALVVIGVPRGPTSSMQAALMAVAGITAIMTSASYFTAATAFPGVAALIPTCGAAMLLLSGQQHSPLITRVLGSAPLVSVGRISYSLYLWHWPFLVITGVYLNRELATVERLAVLAISVGLSILSWRFVEQPFRRHANSPGAVRRALLAGPVCALVCVAMGIAVVLLPPWGINRSDRIAAAEAAQDKINPRLLRCLVSGRGFPPAAPCTFGPDADGRDPSVIVWGDSHADHLVPGIARLADEEGFVGRQVTQNACPPLLGVSPDFNKQCRFFNDAVIQLLEDSPEVRLVILAARWGLYAETKRPGAEQSYQLTDTTTPSFGVEDSAEVLRRGLTRTLDWLGGRGIRALIVTDTPEFGFNPGVCIARELRGERSEERCTLSVKDARRQLASTEKIFATVAAKRANVGLFSPLEAFCDASRCYPSRSGRVLYRDADHLNVDGADYLATMIQHELGSLSRFSTGN